MADTALTSSLHVARLTNSTVTFLFWVWTIVACPLIGGAAGTFPFRDDPGPTVIILLFGGLPATLAVVGGVASRRGTLQVGVAAVVAALLGGLLWVLYIIGLAASGAFV